MFQKAIQKYNAVRHNFMKSGPGPQDRAVWFETTNFGWIWSAQRYDNEGRPLGRKLLLKI